MAGRNERPHLVGGRAPKERRECLHSQGRYAPFVCYVEVNVHVNPFDSSGISLAGRRVVPLDGQAMGDVFAPNEYSSSFNPQD